MDTHPYRRIRLAHACRSHDPAARRGHPRRGRAPLQYHDRRGHPSALAHHPPGRPGLHRAPEPQIAPLILRSDDLVQEALKRFRAGGLDAVPRRYAPGRARTVTPAWEAEVLRVIERDPHDVSVESALWTTGLVARYLARTTGMAVDQETVRVYVHAHGYVCKRPTWTLKRKAADHEGYVGNA